MWSNILFHSQILFGIQDMLSMFHQYWFSISVHKYLNHRKNFRFEILNMDRNHNRHYLFSIIYRYIIPQAHILDHLGFWRDLEHMSNTFHLQGLFDLNNRNQDRKSYHYSEISHKFDNQYKCCSIFVAFNYKQFENRILFHLDF